MLKKINPTLVAIIFMIALLASACAPKTTAAPVIIGDGNKTTITNNITINNVTVDGNANKVQVGDNTFSSTEGQESSNAPTATDAPAATEALAVTNEEVCFFSGWHDGWAPNGPKRISYAGTFSKAALESGTSLQASWDKWSTISSFDNYTVPSDFEPGNDGAFQALVCGDTVYMPERPSTSEFPFWYMSYAKLTSNGLMLCQDDTGSQGSWEGECDTTGLTTTVKGYPIDSITIPSDFKTNWSRLMEVKENWDDETPEHGIFMKVWFPE